MLMVSGMVSVSGMPRAAATIMATPMRLSLMSGVPPMDCELSANEWDMSLS